MGMGLSAERSILRRSVRSWRVLTFALVFFAGVVAIGATGPAISAPIGLAQEAATPVVVEQVGDVVCPEELHGPGAEPWVRAELFFGTTRPDGTLYTEEEWLDFLDAEITPRFPAGLTVLTGLGQWQTDEGIIQERSHVLIILFPSDTAAESSALLEEIREAYTEQFQQTSVLRADSAPVCTSF